MSKCRNACDIYEKTCQYTNVNTVALRSIRLRFRPQNDVNPEQYDDKMNAPGT